MVWVGISSLVITVYHIQTEWLKIQTATQSHELHPVTTHELGMQTKKLLGSKVCKQQNYTKINASHSKEVLSNYEHFSVRDSIKLPVSDTIDIFFYQ